MARIEVFRSFQSSFKFRRLFLLGGDAVVSTPLLHQMYEVGVSELKLKGILWPTEIGF